MDVPHIAALAPLVETVANGGDETAGGILVRAGTNLARGVAVVINRLELYDDDQLVSYQGAVLEACLAAREAFVTELHRLAPGVRVTPPKFEPIVGAYLLGRGALGWPVTDFQPPTGEEGR
jgi:N-acetylglucosamine kinase-like BadF-type ATPase